MSERKSFLLRIDAELYDALRQWAEQEMRSVNGQIEYVLRRAIHDRHGHSAKQELVEKPTEQDDEVS